MLHQFDVVGYQPQKHANSFQVIEYSSKQTIFWVLMQTLTHLKELKSCKFSGHNGIKLDINNKNITENIHIVGNSRIFY